MDSQLTYAALGLACQFTKAFNRINLRRQLRQDGRLITGAGANFEHAALFIQRKQLSHARYDERLRNRLIEIDRQSVIVIRAPAQRFSNKEVPRNAAHSFQDFWIADAVMIAQAFNHTLARNAILGLACVWP